ncbi:hypothetical protein CHUAL_000936 [Chamberlinius hualienensis]
MSKTCAKCERAVYPLEELKCLDKVWHKACFKCQECGMTLSMRNYKGFNRLPYCTAHCPQAKHTTVADTPEIRRIQENTKLQSTVKYHEAFEKQKGKVTQIADDPETLRIKQNTRIISNVAYHGELERKAAMEQKRPMAEGFEDGGMNEACSYDIEIPTVAERMAIYEHIIASELSNESAVNVSHSSSDTSVVEFEYDLVNYATYPGSEYKLPKESEMPIDDISEIASNLPIITVFEVESEDTDRWSVVANCSSVDDLRNFNIVLCDHVGNDVSNAIGTPLEIETPMAITSSSNEDVKPVTTPNAVIETPPPVVTNQGFVGPPRNQTGRVIDEQSQHAKESPYSSRQASTVIYTSEHGAVTNPASRHVGSIADYDPINENFGSLGMPSQGNFRMSGGDVRAMQQQPPPPQPAGLKYRAMYDYTAADSDEVSFLDGDIIVNCTPVDEGWMTGMVQRTGRRGMLPANYVEPVN